MSTKKGSILKTGVIFIIGIILIASSLAVWFYTISPVIGVGTYNLTPGSATQDTLAAQSHTISVNTVDMGGILSNTAKITPKNIFAVQITPALVRMNATQFQVFTSTVLGGVGPFTYQWFLDGNQIAGETNPTLSYTAADSGYHTVYVSVLDKEAEATAISNIAKIVPDNAFSVSVTPILAQLNTGEKQIFSSTTEGGSGNYTYQWYLDNIQIANATLLTYMYTANPAGYYKLYLNTTDTATNATAISNEVEITPKSIFAASIIPLTTQINAGQSQVFSSTVVGGIGPFTYQWFSDNNPVADATNPTWNYTAADSGYHYVYLKATDSSTTTITVSNYARVTPKDAFAVSVTPVLAQLNTNQTQFFLTSIVGGSGSYLYQWYLDGSPVPGATFSGWSYTGKPAGYHDVYVNVVDKNGVNSNVARVAKPGFAVSISPSFVTMSTGGTQQFNSTIQGGTEPYKYQWYLDNATVPDETNFTWTYTAATAGPHTIYLNVVDQNGVSTVSNIARVARPGFAVSIAPSFVTMDSGQTQTFSSTLQGGTGPYKYQWYIDNKLNVTSSTLNFNATFDSPSFIMYFGGIFFNQQPYYNRSRPVDRAFDLSMKITSTGPVNVTVYQRDSPVFNVRTNATYKTLVANTTVGTHTVYANITDIVTQERAISNIARITLKAGLAVYVSPSFVTMNAGETQQFSTTVSGGIAPYSYQWYLDNKAVPGATGPTYSYTETIISAHTVYANITDSAGASAISDIAKMARPGFAVSITPGFAALNLNETQLFNATVQGGSGNFTYQWYKDNKLVTGATDPSWNYTQTYDPLTTILIPNLESTISVSLLDAFTGGITPYVTIQNLDLSSAATISVQYSYSAQFRESPGIPLLMLAVGAVLAVGSGISLIRRLVKHVRQR